MSESILESLGASDFVPCFRCDRSTHSANMTPVFSGRHLICEACVAEIDDLSEIERTRRELNAVIIDIFTAKQI